MRTIPTVTRLHSGRWLAIQAVAGDPELMPDGSVLVPLVGVHATGTTKWRALRRLRKVQP